MHQNNNNASAPNFSVVIPATGADILRNLPRLIRSVNAQTLAPYELIVVLTGADDIDCERTKDIVRSLRIKKTAVHCKRELQHQSASRNVGIHLSNGNWVSFFDADDEMHPRRMKVLARHIYEHSDMRLLLHGFAPRINSVRSSKLMYGEQLFDLEKSTRRKHDWILAEIMHSMATVRKDVVLNTVQFRTDSSFYRREDSIFVRDVIQAVGRHQHQMVYDSAPLGIYSPRPLLRGRLTVKLYSHSLGNNMVAFLSLLGIAKHNAMIPTFDLHELADLNRTFVLGHSLFAVRQSEVYAEGGTFDKMEPLPTFDAAMVKKNLKIGDYLQNAEYARPLQMSLTSLFTFRQKHIDAAKRLLPQRATCVHRRYFPKVHLDAGINACPSAEGLQRLLSKLESQNPNSTFVVFSNDNKRARGEIQAETIQFVDSGPASGEFYNGEVKPLSTDLVARDFAALTLCDDLVITCGTFSGFAGALHSGSRNVYHFNDPMLLNIFGKTIVSSWIDGNFHATR